MLEIEKKFKMLLLDVEEQVSLARKALESPGPGAVEKVEARDDYLDNYESVIENDAFGLIHGGREMTEQQMHYLRAITVAATNLERLGDFAVNIARQTRYFSDPEFIERFDYRRYFDEVCNAVGRVEEAFFRHDMGKALEICRAELALDSLYKADFDDILKKLRAGKQTGDYVTAIFILRYLERMGDSLLNVGEAAIFAITGNKFKIRQFNALNDALEASGERNLLADVEFSSIWGSRSGCRIGRVHEKRHSDNRRDVIFKDGAPKKLEEEAANIERWERLMPGLPPRVVALRRHAKSTSMLVEALPGSTVQDIILSNRPEAVREAMTAMAAVMRELWQRSMKPEPVPAAFLPQLRKRLPGVLKVHPSFDFPRRSIAGAAIPSLRELLDQAESRQAGLQAPFSIFIHGDCNSNNIIYNAEEGRIHYIDLHRSAQGDYCQDVSVFLVSNFRLPVFDAARRRCLNRVTRAFLGFARDFAQEQGDQSFDARLCLGLARSFVTSTRFELNRRFARLMFLRGVYLLQRLAAYEGETRAFELPEEIVFYP